MGSFIFGLLLGLIIAAVGIYYYYNKYLTYRETLYNELQEKGWREFAIESEQKKAYKSALERGELPFFEAVADWVEQTPEEFLSARKDNMKAERVNEPGIYIIHNKTKDMFYVGQGTNVINRASNHFTGSGNGDIYADYKYGQVFTIKVVSLDGSGYESLDAFERAGIRFYTSFSKGYNKTRGNGLAKNA